MTTLLSLFLKSSLKSNYQFNYIERTIDRYIESLTCLIYHRNNVGVLDVRYIVYETYAYICSRAIFKYMYNSHHLHIVNPDTWRYVAVWESLNSLYCRGYCLDRWSEPFL